MKFVQYQACKSPHQLPLARELLRRLGGDNFRYVYRDADQADRASLGWGMGSADEPWQIHIGSHPGEARNLIENAEVLLTGMREIDLFERRASRGLKTFYQTERWFKPVSFAGTLFPGWLRLFHLPYLRMATRFRRLVNNSTSFHVLPIGVHSCHDMKLLGIHDDKMTIWGYFVDVSSSPRTRHRTPNGELKILWVGRMIGWKRVDTIIKAFRLLLKCDTLHLTLVGDGAEKKHLEELANGSNVDFKASVPITDIRELMRSHDVYVLASNAQEGWGAALSEALEEGMIGIGTREAGSSSTILPAEYQFAAGDAKALANLLYKAITGEIKPTGIGKWSAVAGAQRLVELFK